LYTIRSHVFKSRLAAGGDFFSDGLMVFSKKCDGLMGFLNFFERFWFDFLRIWFFLKL
jgi:hypothetical protein